MKRKLLAYLLTLAMALSLLPTAALASGGADPTEVQGYDALKTALEGSAATIKLAGNITSEFSLTVAAGRNVTIDLNGYSITREKTFDNTYYYTNKELVATAPTLMVCGKLTLKDSRTGGSINSNITVKDGIVEYLYSVRNCAVWVDGGTFEMQSGTISATTNGDAAIGVYMTKYSGEAGGTFTMKNGTINVGGTSYLGNAYGVYVGGSTNKAVFTMEGGTINAVAKVVLPNEDGTMPGPTGDGHGVHVDGNGTDSVNGVFNMTGGKIVSAGYGISGDDAAGNTDIDIKNAEISGYAAAIYHPQAGTLDIEDSTLTGTTGLEAKGGTINIKSGIFNSLLEPGQGGRTYGSDQNKGISTKGWAVAVVNNNNYNTTEAVVTIDGGVYNAPMGVFDDSEPDTETGHNYKLVIKGGTFQNSVRMYGYDTEKYTSYGSTVKPAETDSIVITGGTFKYAPTYHVDGKDYVVVKNTSGNHKVVAASAVDEVAQKDATCTAVGNIKYYEYEADEGETTVACYKWSDARDNQVYAWDSTNVKSFYVYYTNDAYLISAVEHEWEKKSETAAGEATEGSITYKCKNCTEENKVTLEPIGVHHDDSKTGTLTRHNKVEANCKTLTNGTKEYWTCSNTECKDKKFVKSKDDSTFVEVEDKDLVIKYAHEIEKIEGKDATCTESGLTDGTKCRTCEVTLNPPTDIPAKGHTRSVAERVDETSANCTIDGSYEEIIKCSTCNKELSSTKVVVPALGHDLAYVSDGSAGHHQKCTREDCNYVTSTEAHTYGSNRTCGLCGYTKSSGGSSSGGSSSGGSSSSTTYAVSVDKTTNGSVSVSPKNASKGTTVTVTTTPDKGWTLETLTVLDKDGKEVDLKTVTVGEKYTFTMPSGKVEIKATFMEDNTILNYFADVKASDYFYDAVLWAAENGITTGVDDLHFAPETSCTRAQIVTFLWRAAGSPEPKSVSSFTDVASDSYYAKAVAWAIENGITNGTGNDKFSPDETCTRAQSVTFLARALDGKATANAEFSDVPADSWYAEAVAWAAANGVTEGIGGGLFGSGDDCTRGQIVTFLFRAYVK